MARNVLLRLTGDSSDAQRAIKGVREEVRRLAREQATAHIDVQIAQAERQLLGFRRQFEEVSNSTASPEVKLAGQERLARNIERLELRLLRLGRRKVSIDVDVKRGALERTAAGLGTVERGIKGVVTGVGDAARGIPVIGQVFATVVEGIVSGISAIGGAIGALVTSGLKTLLSSFESLQGIAAPIGAAVGSLVSLGVGLAGIAALGGVLVIALNAVIGAIIALGGALVALVASAAAAAAGLGALAVAFGAALVPIALVAIGVFQRFQAILKARQAQQQELAQATQAQKTADQAHAAALEQVRQAEQRLGETTVAARRAAQQAILDQRDAELGLASSRLGVKESRLGLAQARKDLKDFLAQAGAAGPQLSSLVKQFTNVDFHPGSASKILSEATGSKTQDPLALQRLILGVQRAQLSYKESINQTTHAEQTLKDATAKRADFVRRGLKAYAPYRAALHQVQQSEQRLARATDAVSRSHTKYEQALHKLTGTERGSLARLNSLVSGFTKLAKAFSDPVFGALNAVFDSLKGKAGAFEGGLKAVGTAFGGVIRSIGQFLGEPATLSAFKTMATGAAELVRELGAHAFRSFLTIMREVAVTALPAVTSAARHVSSWLAQIAGQPGRIHSAVKTVVDQFKVWLRFAGAVSRLVIALFSAAAPAGKSLATSMTHIVNRWTAWIKANPEKVRAFFRHAIAETKKIVHWLGQAFHWLQVNLPKAAQTAKHAFEGVYNVVKKIIDGVRWIQNASTDIANAVGAGANPADVANVIRNDLAIVNRDVAQLKKHQTPERRSALRTEVIQALQELLNRRGSVGRQIDLSKANRSRLETILSNLLAAQARPPRVHSPDTRSPDAKAHGSAVHGDFHAHITVPGGGSPDPRVTLHKIAREAQKLGLVAP